MEVKIARTELLEEVLGNDGAQLHRLLALVEELQRTIPYLNLQMKALIARDLWGMDEYFAIFNESNDAVLRALQLIKK